MRGKVFNNSYSSVLSYITPAHAGKSFTPTLFYTSFQDHPRTCGEKMLQGLYHQVLTGSPPHMRGKGLSHIQLH